MITDITVIINADDDAMVGSEGWGEHDARQSTQVFVEQVRERIVQAFPGAEVEVRADTGLVSTKIEINADEPAGDDEEYIRELIAEVWQGWGWLVAA